MNREETMEEKYINKMKEFEKEYEIGKYYSKEELHMDFDDCILDFLEELGYEDIVKYYRNSRNKYIFWYA